MNASAESQRHRMTGIILMVLAGVCILPGVVLLIFLPQQYMAVITFVIIAMVFGNYAFQHLEKSAEIKPESDIRHEMEPFGARLKNGSDVTIYLELYYPIDQDSPYVFDRITAHCQYSLSRALLQIDRLPDDQYAFIDSILRAEITHLCTELNLRNLTLKTIDVNAKPPAAAGVWLRTK
jgi:hypothetical protein